MLPGLRERELRPEIFRLATERGWVLWELHRERATLEQVFRELTMDDGGEHGRETGEEDDEA